MAEITRFGIETNASFFSDDNSAYLHDSTRGTICSAPTALEIDRHLGWTEPGERHAPDQFAAASESLSRILHFISTGEELHSVGLRCIALVSVLRPDLLDCKGSQQAIADKFGVQRAAVQKYARQIRNLCASDWQGHNQRGQRAHDAGVRNALQQHTRAGRYKVAP
jgi:hypothetical protein